MWNQFLLAASPIWDICWRLWKKERKNFTEINKFMIYMVYGVSIMCIECGTVEIISIINAAHIQQMTCTHTERDTDTVMPKRWNTNTWRKQPAQKTTTFNFLFIPSKTDFILDSEDEKRKKKKTKSVSEINAHFMQQRILMSCLSIVFALRYQSIPYGICWNFDYEMALFAFSSRSVIRMVFIRFCSAIRI